ncbi:FAD-dependent monooxygenase [Umezawaea sp. Da 62-37]|uniref:FAD-dependent monooxygenase n=1 Tax=Umezawaea sp. Da 62-37 TaxID=3075927 RepID=UPI0028F74DAA|nr:FAD-dependent monooxygenase [Umezawaea sp. Da 62-37]WNV88895.1 FAD-dependent monooxygenase [Umezawaea sp. Da 62-37]
MTKAVVVGAGIGGLVTAVALRRVGIEVEVYERALEPRAAGTGLSIMSNAVAALRGHGIELALEDRGRAIESFRLNTFDGRPIRAVPVKSIGDRLGAPSVCVHRADLRQALLEAAGDCPIATGAAATRFTADGDGVRVDFADGRVASGDVLIGADGFHSAVRAQLTGPETPRDAGYLCWLATIPFRHKALPDGHVAHYWGRGSRFGLVDIGHGRVYWWGTGDVREWDGGKEQVLRVYDGWADEVRAAVEATPVEAIVGLAARDRPFLRKWGEGPVTLLGDAAHPMLTSFGQGAGMAIEDAVVLARCLAGETDPRRALRRYEDERRARTRQVVRASRALSRFEQAGPPGARFVRDASFRWMPERLLRRLNESALTFPATTGTRSA